jgi:hypothetical protein
MCKSTSHNHFALCLSLCPAFHRLGYRLSLP